MQSGSAISAHREGVPASVHLKRASSFPNWNLALEFLKRADHHFLVTGEVPPDLVSGLEQRIILRGIAEPGSYVSVPKSMDDDCVIAICGALLAGQAKTSGPFIGSIRSSNFFVFLDRFAQTLKGKFELEEVAQSLTGQTSELFEAEGASILLPNEAGTSFRFAYLQTSSSEVGDCLSQIEIPAGKGVIGWVAENRRPILVNDTGASPFFNPAVDKCSQFQTHNLLAAPIFIGQELIGILEVVNKRRGLFQDSDIRIAELIAAIIAIFIEKAQLYGERLRLVMVDKELEIASALQTHLMPQLPVDLGPFRVSGESRQLSRVGGDFWDILRLNAHERLLILGDVSGHGLSAALVMTAVRTALRALLPQTASAHELLNPLNTMIHDEFSPKYLYVTLLFCHLDLNRGKLSFARAGHEHPLLRRSQSIQILNKKGGYPLGLLGAAYEATWHDLDLGDGAQLYLYTDGVTDGFGDTHSDLIKILGEVPDIDHCLEKGCFFERLASQFNWRSHDDATFLKLALR